MKVRVTYEDSESYTIEEAVSKAQTVFGGQAKVEVLPLDPSLESFLHYTVQALVTPGQLEEFFDGENNLTTVRQAALKKVESMINRVIIENEEKLIVD